MTLTTITQSDSQVQSSIVYEYSLTVANPEDQDTQHLTAAFTSVPTSIDWQQWLSGWQISGYSLSTEPVLIRTL